MPANLLRLYNTLCQLSCPITASSRRKNLAPTMHKGPSDPVNAALGLGACLVGNDLQLLGTLSLGRGLRSVYLSPLGVD